MRLTKVIVVCVASIAFVGAASTHAAGQSVELAQSTTDVASPRSAKQPLLAQPAHLVVRDASLDQAISELQSTSGVSLVYSPTLVQHSRTVTCNCATTTVGGALAQLLKDTGLTYSEYRNAVLIEPPPAARSAVDRQTRTVHGVVTDSISGEPIQNGQVSIIGTAIGATLRSDGAFTLQGAPMQAFSLFVRSLGFSPRTVTVAANQDTVRIKLTRSYFRLEEIVVTGQATGVQKRNLANAIATVDADQLARVPAATLENALQGKVAGVHISENSGAPGGGNIVRMRGVTSIYGAFTPLYVVDGVIVSDVNLGTGTNAVIGANGSSLSPASGNEDNGDNRIADLNVDDIANVEVLKGASASAIYGSKAANGVIIITTKRGHEGPPQIDITQRVGVSRLDHEFGHRCFTQDEAVATFGAQAATSWTPACHDFEQELYGGTPPSYETTVSARGGSATTQYFASGESGYDGGIVPNTSARRQSLRLNLDQQIGSRVSLSIGAEALRTERNPGVTQNGNNGTPIGGAIAYGGATWLDLRQAAEGTFPANPFAASNPFQTVALFRNDENVTRNILSERLTVNLLDNDRQKLQFISTGGLDMFTQKNFVLAPPELFSEQFLALPGASELSFAQSQDANINANLVHTLHLGNASSATTQVGLQYETQSLDQDNTLAQGLAGGLSNIGEGLAVRTQENRLRVHDMGLFAQEEFLTLDQRLLLTLGVRADQSSNNGDPTKLSYYPKASASYRIPGMPSFFDEFKLRAAFGYSGNEPLYGQKFTELVPSNIAGTIPILGIQGSTGASDLRPERQREIETGIDATMLHSRLDFEGTVYEKRVTDLLLQEALAPTTGFSSLYFNGGSMRNRGIELSLSGVPVQTSKFTWRTTGTYSMSRCTILSLPVPAFRPATTINGATFGYTFIQPGASCTQIWGRDTLGAEPGDAQLGAIGTEVQRKIADDNPDFNASWANTLDYGRLHLTTLLDGQRGGVLVNITEYEYDATKTSPDYLVPRHAGDLTGEQRQAAFAKSSRPYIQSVSYLKLREVSLSYDMPEAFAKHLWGGIRSARLEFSARNLFTITPYESTADPEANQIARSAASGVPWDIWAYPPSRSYYLSIHVGI